jgi:hypothetical protein
MFFLLRALEAKDTLDAGREDLEDTHQNNFKFLRITASQNSD